MPSEAQIEKSFRNGVSSIVDDTRISALRDAISRNDIEAVLEVIDIEPAAFEELRGLLVQQYAESGIQSIKSVKGARWNSANPRVEHYARNDIAGMITGLSDDMRVAVRNSVADGYAFGRSVDRMALELVGRVGPNGSRYGGIVGLSSQQEQWLRNMRAILEADPKRALRYGKRDRRFDKLLASGRPLGAAEIDRITRQYANKLLLSRGRQIARTERGKAINNGRVEAWRQASEKLGFPLSEIRKEWRYTYRSRENRHSHVIINGEVVSGLDSSFSNGMRWPHDDMSPPSETINCMCEVKIWRA